MALCKAMMLVGALLFVTTLQMRIKQPEEMMKHVNPKAELVVESEEAAAPSQDFRRTPKLIGQGDEKEGGKGTDKGKGMAKDAVKDNENKLVKGKGKGTDQGKNKMIRKGGEFPSRKFRFPVLNGKWWIHRLAFMRGEFAGFVYQEVPDSKTLLIKSWKAQEDFDDEAIIPQWANYVEAKVGDKITFDVGAFAQEGEGKPRPMATNVVIREREHTIGTGLIMAPPPTDVRTQVLFYISDDNLRTDKFFQDIIAATEGGWISTDFLLLCRRMKQLGASPMSIIESLRDAPGVEVRDTPGQEAIRRKSAPPPMEPGTIARKEAVFPTLEDPWAAKKTYALGLMKSMGDLPVENTMEQMLALEQEELAEVMLDWEQEELAKVAGPEADDQELAPGVAESPQEQKLRPSRAKKAWKKGEASRKADGDARRAKVKASTTSKEAEKARESAKKAAVEKAAAKKVAAEKPAAKKALAETGPVAEEKAAAEKAAAFVKRSTPGQAAVDKAATEQAAAEQPSGEAANLVPNPTSDNGNSWGSWFSMLPRAARGYLGLPATPGSPGDEVKKARVQDADAAKERQEEMQTMQRNPAQ